MNALTRDMPKCLTPLAGRRLLDLQVEALRGAGVQSIGVVRGYRAELIDRDDLERFDNPRWPETNMVRSLACAARWLRDQPTIVSYGDIFYPSSAVAALRETDADIAITYDSEWRALWCDRFADPLSDAETFELDGNRVIEIGRRAESLDRIQGQFMGLLKFTPAGWLAVENYVASLSVDRADRLDMTSLLSALIDRGQHVEGVRVAGGWGEIDNPGDVALYERWIAAGRLTLPGLPLPAARP